MEKLAARYAEALLSIALDEGKNGEYREEIKQMIEVFEQSAELLSVLHSSFITKEEKKSVLSEILKEEPFPYIRDFILLIVDRSRVSHLMEILKEFVKLSNKADHICEGYVYSVTRLSPEEMKEITSAIERKLKKKVVLHNRLDDSLIGGVKVIADDSIFDGSVKNKLKQLKQHLQEGAQG